jgi:hypothetical protein
VTPSLGTVINVHRLGATVRLADGTLAAIPYAELCAHPDAIDASLHRREPIALEVEQRGRHVLAFLARPDRAPAPGTPVAPPVAPLSIHDSLFEEQMRRYLKETEEWAPPDRPHPAERHFIRKKRRAAYFEGRAR